MRLFVATLRRIGTLFRVLATFVGDRPAFPRRINVLDGWRATTDTNPVHHSTAIGLRLPTSVAIQLTRPTTVRDVVTAGIALVAVELFVVTGLGLANVLANTRATTRLRGLTGSTIERGTARVRGGTTLTPLIATGGVNVRRAPIGHAGDPAGHARRTITAVNATAATIRNEITLVTLVLAGLGYRKGSAATCRLTKIEGRVTALTVSAATTIG
jgi:hypothetical protein